MESFKAVPTEYQGIRYKSKSEAMFAHWLSLNGTSLAIGHSGVIYSSGFQYEPHGLAVDNDSVDRTSWLVDFVQWNVVSNINDVATFIPVIQYSIIEYKPSKPTNTYLLSLARRFDRIKQNYDFLVGSEFYCFYGSVFNQCDVLRYRNSEWKSSGVNWIEGFEDDMQSVRFDLVGS